MVPTHSPIKWVQKAVLPVTKRPGRKADQLLSSSVEVLNQCNYAPPPITHPTRLHGVHRAVFDFYLM